MNKKHEIWANALRNKYNNILAQDGRLSEQDYENMVSDVKKCTDQDESCRSVMLGVLEEFDKRK
jgi:hypothetical protein